MRGKNQLLSSLKIFQKNSQIVITSMLVCEQHYDGAKHNRKIAVELEKFHQARGSFLIIHSLIILIEVPV